MYASGIPETLSNKSIQDQLIRKIFLVARRKGLRNSFFYLFFVSVLLISLSLSFRNGPQFSNFHPSPPLNFLVPIPHYSTRQFIVSSLIPHKMRKTILVLVLVMAVAAAFSSCASSRGGCKMSQGFVGYGSPR
jgi:hypothetical protein